MDREHLRSHASPESGCELALNRRYNPFMQSRGSKRRKIWLIFGLAPAVLWFANGTNLVLFKFPLSWAAWRLSDILPGDTQSVLEGAPQLTLYSLKPIDRITSSCTPAANPDCAPCTVVSWRGNNFLTSSPAHSPTVQETPTFYDNYILGQTQISGSTKSDAIHTLYQGLVKGAVPMMCFEPRLGMRAVKNGRTLDMVICFECQQMVLRMNGKQAGGGLISSRYKPYFDKLFDAAKVPYDKAH